MGNKKLMSAIISTLLILTLTASAVALSATDGTQLSGSHYTLNIIGVQNPKTATMDSSNGHVIFVPLEGKSEIDLVEGDDFAVLDANATGGSAALLQLPDPGLDPYVIGDPGDADTVSDYSVFVRSLGKPGGWATITTCAELQDSTFAGLLSGKFLSVLNRAGEFGGYASIEQVGQDITLRTKGRMSFTNVTAELLTIVFKVEVDTNDDGTVDMIQYVRVPIFSDILEGEYWEYDNNNLKLLQVRFYPIGTDVSASDLEEWQ